MPKKIIFVYNQVTEKERKGYFSECTLIKDVKAIKEGLEQSNNQVLCLDLETPEQLDDFIERNKPIDLAFVIAEGFKGNPHTLYSGNGAALVRKHILKHHIPCTHSGVESMEICRHKDQTYAKLKEQGVLIPEYLVFDTHFLRNMDGLFKETHRIGYPLIIKPSGGGNSIGISDKSIVYNIQQLKDQIIRLTSELGPGQIIIEKYLSGQEYTVGIIGNEVKYVLPAIGFPINLGLRDTKIKKMEHQIRESFEIINGDDRFAVFMEIVVNTFDAVYARDVLRVDMKEDSQGNIYVIDVNGTPALSLTGSLNFMAGKVNITHQQLVNLVLYESMISYGLMPNSFMEEQISEIKTKINRFNVIEVA